MATIGKKRSSFVTQLCEVVVDQDTEEFDNSRSLY